MRLCGAPSSFTAMADAEPPAWITVEVAYALPDRQFLQPVTLPAGATVAAAIRASGVLEQMRNAEFSEVFALYNNNASDDPGGAGTVPARFDGRY